MSMKKQLLDPLGTVCKLVGLNFAKIKTKISIQNHILSLDEPDQLQFFMRWYNGDGRENVSEIYYVIIRIIKWYLMPDKYNPETPQVPSNSPNSINSISSISPQKLVVNGMVSTSADTFFPTDDSFNRDEDTGLDDDDGEDSEVKSVSSIYAIKESNSTKIAKCPQLFKLIQYLCDAFEHLQETYQFGNVVLTLQYFINLLHSALDGTFNDSMLPAYIRNKENEFENLLDYNKMKNLWEEKTLVTICELYDNCFRVMNDTDIHPKTKNALIDGYLMSVSATLEIKGTEFQTLILNSKKG